MKRYIVEDLEGNVLYTVNKFNKLPKLLHMCDDRIRRIIKNPSDRDPIRIKIDDEGMPDVLWLVVSHDKYEFPLRIYDSGQDLCKGENISESGVYSAINHARRRKCFCKYKRVEIKDV